eukprot:m51a1_g9767 hypothetical protein (318) ;mRNA; r:1650546-1651589
MHSSTELEPQATEITERTGLRLLFLNTHLFTHTAPALFSPKLTFRDSDRLRELCARLVRSDFDAVVLSEVWATSSLALIARLVAKVFPHSWWPKMPASARLGPGLMVLSRTPIQPLSFIEFTDLCGWDKMTRKGVAAATVGDTTLVLTHTQAGVTPEAVDARMQNMEQVYAAVDWAKTVSPVPGRVVVVGDFNILERGLDATSQQQPQCATSAEYEVLRSRLGAMGLVDSYREAHPDATSHPGTSSGEVEANAMAARWSKDSYAGRLDYVFVPKGTGVLAAETVRDWKATDTSLPESHPCRSIDVSDHWPLAVHIAL